MIIRNNKKEFKNLVMSLTNEDLKILNENQNILPLLIKNRIENNLEKNKTKLNKKNDLIKKVNFGNNSINLFLKGNKKNNNFNIKTNFSEEQKKEFDKNISSINYDDIKHNNNKGDNKLSKNPIYKKINLNRNSQVNNDENALLKKELNFLGYKSKLHANQYNKEEIKKGEQIWEKWIEGVMNKNKNNNKNNDKKNNKDIDKKNKKIFKKKLKKEEEVIKKILFKKLIRQNSSKVSNNIKTNENKNDIFILPEEIYKILKDNNYHNYKSVIINEERVLNKIKNKYFIDIFSYINTPQGKLNLKLIFNTDEKSTINKKINSNQIKNKILLQAFLPKIFEQNDNQIPNPYIIHNSENEEEDDDDKEEISEKNDNDNFLNNLDYVPISLKKFFLEKYKVSEIGIYSKINNDIKNELNKRNNKKKYKTKKIITTKLVIKVDNHNEKMINNYLNKLKAKKDKRKEKNNSNNKNNNKTKQNENDEIINKNEEKRIINLFGLNISINKGKTPLQHLKDYMAKKGINSSKELEKQIKLKNNLSKLIAKLQLLKKKKRRKVKIKSIKNFSKLLDINYNTDNLVKLANNGINPDLTSSKKLKYFDTNLIKSRKDAEKRKMQLLL